MGLLNVGDRIWVGYGFDMSKARKATVIDFELQPSWMRTRRPIVRLDGETATLTLPGNAAEILPSSMLCLGSVKDEG